MLIPTLTRDTAPATVRGLRAALASGALDVSDLLDGVLGRVAARRAEATGISVGSVETLHAGATEPVLPVIPAVTAAQPVARNLCSTSPRSRCRSGAPRPAGRSPSRCSAPPSRETG